MQVPSVEKTWHRGTMTPWDHGCGTMVLWEEYKGEGLDAKLRTEPYWSCYCCEEDIILQVEWSPECSS